MVKKVLTYCANIVQGEKPVIMICLRSSDSAHPSCRYRQLVFRQLFLRQNNGRIYFTQLNVFTMRQNVVSMAQYELEFAAASNNSISGKKLRRRGPMTQMVHYWAAQTNERKIGRHCRASLPHISLSIDCSEITSQQFEKNKNNFYVPALHSIIEVFLCV